MTASDTNGLTVNAPEARQMTVVYHSWPRGWHAVWFGFCFAAGIGSLISVVTLLHSLAKWIGA